MSSKHPLQDSSRILALVALHAGYSHTSPALQSIAAYAKDQPFRDRLKLFEALVNTHPQPLIESLVAARPRVIGFSTYVWNIAASIHISRLLKQLLPDCVIVFGGPEAGARGEELLTGVSALDFVVQGEGEAAFSDLVNILLYGQGRLGDVSGLIYRHDGSIRHNPVRLLPVERIPAPIALGMMAADKPLVYWETSRGCPYRCSFCSSATERLRSFPLERVEADLQVLQRLENKTVKLLDRSFHLGRERTVKLLKRFAATPPGLRFHLELNPDRISEEAMAVFRHALPGKFQFEIGLQSLNETVLEAIDRRMAIPKALENINRLLEMRRHPVHLDLIVGLPGETAAQCATSLDQTFRLYPDHLQLGTLKLLPGTPLRKQAHRLGYCWDPEPPYEVLAHPSLAFTEIARFKRYAELLERLWNSGYLRSTLAGLVDACYTGRVSRCFDELLEALGEGLARDNLQPDSLFAQLTRFILPRLQTHPLLGEWLVWDYSQFSLVNGKTPAWIAERLQQTERFVVDGSRRRVPILRLTEEGIRMINRFNGRALRAGSYAVWPKQHKKGRPVEIIATQ
ncbi:MAG: B12-binding domain-containing radical SAM protein [Candidatus Thiodiazotropha sp. (ex Dulcina madagascariensis)]|nr:B12-binding domain-containing radical SAM protein [Candidatus Thiodiazotropha sp. (ex Dulcina madagascariensis)]